MKRLFEETPQETKEEKVVAEAKKEEVTSSEGKKPKPATPKPIAAKAIDKAQDHVEKPQAPQVKEAKTEISPEESERLKTQYKKLDGPKLTGTVIDLKQFERPKKKKEDTKKDGAAGDKKKRKRIVKPTGPGQNRQGGKQRSF